MAKPIQSPHDSFFRETFSRREVAEGFLRGYLPPALAEGIDWDTLAIAQDSFVEKHLRRHFSDLLYTARHRGADIHVYLLIEHKSHPDRWVSLQLLRYMARVWELRHKQQPEAPLPPIVPLVLYHGRRDWRTPAPFRALFGELDPLFDGYLPDFRHELCDLALPEPEAAKRAVLSRLALLALKHVFDPAPKQALAEMLPLVRQMLDKNTALEMLEVLLRYYVQATRKLDERDIHELLTHTDEEDIMQTFIDRYIEQGKQEGWLLGKQEGRQEGRQEGEQTVLLRLLTRKFGDLTPAQRRRVQRADSEALLRWSEQVLFAATADEALR